MKESQMILRIDYTCEKLYGWREMNHENIEYYGSEAQ